ncbi:hypothetical protein [Dyadobacter sp. 32]|uniref:hypothetical protein n=1 Tax=Dyadobacter sp. 32 TaxID=538966 RepID=UPI0011ED1537
MRGFRKTMGLVAKLIAIIFVTLLLVVFAKPLWNKYIVYPELEKDRTKLWKTYRKPKQFIGNHDFKGVLHSHTYRSHDSRGQLNEILPAARQASLDFIFLADHRISDQDSFPRGIHGMFDGILIESGTESPGAAMMVNPLKATIIDWKKERNQIIREVVGGGGMAFYLHSEENHDWGNADYQGMEIYNIHTDLKDEKNPVSFLINGMVNSGKHRHWSYRELFDEQTKITSLWDSLNNHRKIVGMAAVDAHNNQSIRARYLPDGRVEWVGSNAKTLSITKPGWKEKLLLSKPDVAGWAFKMELDTYFHSFNFVNTHLFGDTLSSRSLKNELVKGHAYVAFESLAQANGFQYFATDANGKLNAILGDSIQASQAYSLQAVSPFPVRFELYRSGKLIDSRDNSYEYKFSPDNKPGNYRIVARITLRGTLLPWVYTNPIYVY